MTSCSRNLPVTYREYKFAADFPILLMEVKSTTPQIDFIHFHNCIEIAFCQSGTMTWNLENQVSSFHRGISVFFLPSLRMVLFFRRRRVRFRAVIFFLIRNSFWLLFIPTGFPVNLPGISIRIFPSFCQGSGFVRRWSLSG